MICDVSGESQINIKNNEGLTPVEISYEENTQEAYPYLCDRFKLK